MDELALKIALEDIEFLEGKRRVLMAQCKRCAQKKVSHVAVFFKLREVERLLCQTYENFEPPFPGGAT